MQLTERIEVTHAPDCLTMSVLYDLIVMRCAVEGRVLAIAHCILFCLSESSYTAIKAGLQP